MITVLVNGQPRDIHEGAFLSDLIAEMNLTGKRIAIEMNGEIVPKTQHASTPLLSNAQLEIVVAVGGG